MTTSPMTLAICIGSLTLKHVHVVHDSDNYGVHGAVLHPRGHPRGAPTDDEHRFADTGIDGIHCDEIVPFRFSLGIHGTGHEQLVADESRILPRSDHSPDNAGENHLGGQKNAISRPRTLHFVAVDLPVGSVSSRLACGRGMTCTDTSSPTRRAAAAPASVAAFTAATSPRPIAVTYTAPMYSSPTSTTSAVFTIASAASSAPIRPLVSISPKASNRM